VGAAVGVLTIVVARALRGERWLYSLGLIALPGLYASFALSAGLPAVTFQELTWGAPWIVAGLLFTFVGVRRSAVVVGLFWLLHGLFDLMHDRLYPNPGVPLWYPVFCFVVDVVVGVYLLRLSRRLSDGDLHRA
jgi:hypothetical protein